MHRAEGQGSGAPPGGAERRATESPTPAHAADPQNRWCVASARLARLAAGSFGFGAGLDEAAAILRPEGVAAVAVLICPGNTVSEVYAAGFGRGVLSALEERYLLGHRLFEPCVAMGDGHTHSLSRLMRQEGIGGYCGWPLSASGRMVGEIYVGLPSPADRSRLPPPAFMDSVASIFALAVDRHLLISSAHRGGVQHRWRERLLESLVQSREDAILVADVSGRVLLLNPGGEQLLGIEEAVVIGNRLRDIDPKLGFGDGGAGFGDGGAGFGDGGAGGEIVGSRVSAFSHGGREYVVWSLRRTSPSRGRLSGAPPSVGNDRMAVFTCDPDGTVSACNATMVRLFGGPGEVGKGLSVWASESLVRAGIVSRVEACLSSGAPVVSSHEIDHPGLGNRFLTAHFSPVGTRDGRPAGVQAIIEDTTDYVRTRSSLMQSEERYRLFFRNAPIALLEVDFSAVVETVVVEAGISTAWQSPAPEAVTGRLGFPLRLTAANPAAVSLYGAESQAALIDAWDGDLNTLSPEELDRLLTAFQAREGTHRFDTVHRTLSGRCLHVSVSAAVAPGHETDFSRVLLSIVDITPLKVMEAAMKGQLVLERLISTISARFVSMRAEEAWQTIAAAIHEVGEALDVDTVIVFARSGHRLEVGHAWARFGQEPLCERICRAVSEAAPSPNGEWEAADIDGGAQAPEDSSLQRRLDGIGLRSLLMMRLAAQGSPTGMMLLASAVKPRQWLEESTSLLRILADVVAGALERKLREEQRHRSDALLRTIFQSMPGGLIVVDEEGRVCLVNPGAARSLRIGQPSELVGRPLGEVVRGVEALLRGARPGEQQRVTLTLDNGARRAVVISTSAVSGHRIILLCDG